MNVIHTCHGILSNQGRDSTDFMGELLRPEFEIKDCNYPDLHSWQMRDDKRLTQNAERLFTQSEDGDHVIAHSYGALVFHRAMEMGRRFGYAFLFAPCMDRDVLFPFQQYAGIYVVYEPRDLALLAASFLPNHPAGGLGRYGYCGESSRVYNVRGVQNSKSFLRHSDPFQPANIGYWIRFIRGVINNE